MFVLRFWVLWCSVETWMFWILKKLENVRLYMIRPTAAMNPRMKAIAFNFEGSLKLIEESNVRFLLGVWKFFGLCVLNVPVLFFRVF